MIPDLLSATAVALLLLFFPGLLLVRRAEWEGGDLLGVLAPAFLGAAAFWATAIWFVPRGFLVETAAAVVLVTAAALLARLARCLPSLRSGPRVQRRTLLLALLLLLVSVFRVGSVAVRRPPSAGDLTMHAYMVELLVIHEGLPASHEPLLPISTFGENSPGLHALAALVRLVSGLSAHACALLVGALALVLLSLGIDRLLRITWPTGPRTAQALAALGVVFLARNPQMYLTWGGVPTVLSQALAFYLLAECIELLRRRDVVRSLRAGLIAAGAALTHLIPVLTFAYVLAGLVVLALVRERSKLSLRAAVLNASIAALGTCALLARFLRLRSLSADQQTVEWAREWIRLELTRSHGLLQRLIEPLGLPPDLVWLLTFPPHVFVFLGLLATGMMAWWLIRSALRSVAATTGAPAREAAAPGAVPRGAPAAVAWTIVGVLAVLHCASIGEFLPYWMGLYPNRIHVFLLLPVAFAMTELFAWLGGRKPLIWATVLAVLMGIALESRSMGPDGSASHGGLLLDGLVRTYTDSVNSRVTDDDLLVLDWIRKRTDREAVVANNAGDGGQLIPALCRRKVTAPHYQPFWYRKEMERWAADRPDYLFVGAASHPAFPCEYDAAFLKGKTDLDLVLRVGESRLYRFVPDDATQRLAAVIRTDPDLRWVLAEAREVVSSGLTAGEGYGEVWIRDLASFVELACDSADPAELRTALLRFCRLQGSDGNMPDGFVIRKDGLLEPHKNTVETDQETSLVLAVAGYVRGTGDRGILGESVAGETVLARLERALQFVLDQRFDESYGLVWGATTADWGDVQPEDDPGILLNEKSHRAIDVYDNAMFLLAVADLIELLEGEQPDGEGSNGEEHDSGRRVRAAVLARWRDIHASVRERARAALWDAESWKFVPHVYLEASPFPAGFDEDAVFYHGSTGVAMAADLLTLKEIESVLNTMRRNVLHSGAASIGLTLYPPYPAGFFQNRCMKPFSYQNGGDWTWFGGRIVQALIRHGLVWDAYAEARPMFERARVNDGFFEWYSLDNRPQGSAMYRGSAGVLGLAGRMLLEWAERVEDKYPAGTNRVSATCTSNDRLSYSVGGIRAGCLRGGEAGGAEQHLFAGG